MVALARHEAGVKVGERRVEVAQTGGEDLEFFATPAFDQREGREVVDDLLAPAFAHGLHHTANPRAALRSGEGDAALGEQAEHEIEVLQFLDGDGVQLAHATVQLGILFEVERRGGGFAFEMGVVHQHRREIRADHGQPGVGELFAPEEHGVLSKPPRHARPAHIQPAPIGTFVISRRLRPPGTPRRMTGCRGTRHPARRVSICERTP